MLLPGQSKKQNTLRKVFDLYHNRIFNFVLKHTEKQEFAKSITGEVLSKIWKESSTAQLTDQVTLEKRIFELAKKAVCDHYQSLILARTSFDFVIKDSLQPTTSYRGTTVNSLPTEEKTYE